METVHSIFYEIKNDTKIYSIQKVLQEAQKIQEMAVTVLQNLT